MVFFHLYKAKSPTSRLAKVAGPDGIVLLTALFERTQSQSWVNARKFRVDFKDQRDTIQELLRRGFITSTQDPIEQYRPSLAALPLIDSNAARSLLKKADRLLRYLERQYEAGCDQMLTVAQISRDIRMPQQALIELLRYLVDTPVVGPRTTGFPDSPNWGLTPTEKSLDYPNIDALLMQLAWWSSQKDVPVPRAPYPVGIAYQPLATFSPATRYDRLVDKIKNNPVGAIVLALSFLIVSLVAGLEGGRDLVAMIVSLSWIHATG